MPCSSDMAARMLQRRLVCAVQMAHAGGVLLVAQGGQGGGALRHHGALRLLLQLRQLGTQPFELSALRCDRTLESDELLERGVGGLRARMATPAWRGRVCLATRHGQQRLLQRRLLLVVNSPNDNFALLPPLKKTTLVPAYANP